MKSLDPVSDPTLAQRVLSYSGCMTIPASCCQSMRQLLEDEGIDTSDLPPRSPDLKPIEHQWDIIVQSFDPIIPGCTWRCSGAQWCSGPDSLFWAVCMEICREIETVQIKKNAQKCRNIFKQCISHIFNDKKVAYSIIYFYIHIFVL